ncbi:MAG: fimbria/pilus periplasmic chaperone [Pseudomonas sp.]
MQGLISAARTLLFLLILMPICSWASVTMTGNRIIYPASATTVDVQLSNKDALPYVMQCWFDDGDTESTPQTGKAPFLVTPPMFRIAPQSGQVLRIAYSGDKTALPTDRESVFYFNFLQIPPNRASAENNGKNNLLLVLLRNRVKVFYRPDGLGKPVRQVASLDISLKHEAAQGAAVTLGNTHPWFASVASVVLSQDGKQWASRETDMISPFAQRAWQFPDAKLVAGRPVKVKVTVVNDQGAMESHEYVLAV